MHRRFKTATVIVGGINNQWDIFISIIQLYLADQRHHTKHFKTQILCTSTVLVIQSVGSRNWILIPLIDQCVDVSRQRRLSLVASTISRILIQLMYKTCPNISMGLDIYSS